jgi:hypothetical protein
MDFLKGLIELVLLMKVSGFGMHVLNNTHQYSKIRDIMVKIGRIKTGLVMNIE